MNARSTRIVHELPKSIFCLEFIGRTGGSVWLLIEATRYHRLMKLRLALGLADPIVTNRFLLWSLAGVAGLIMLATAVPPVFMSHELELLMNIDMVVFSLAGLATCILFSLAFFPPPAYKSWLMARAAEAA